MTDSVLQQSLEKLKNNFGFITFEDLPACYRFRANGFWYFKTKNNNMASNQRTHVNSYFFNDVIVAIEISWRTTEFIKEKLIKIEDIRKKLTKK